MLTVQNGFLHFEEYFVPSVFLKRLLGGRDPVAYFMREGLGQLSSELIGNVHSSIARMCVSLRVCNHLQTFGLHQFKLETLACQLETFGGHLTDYKGHL